MNLGASRLPSGLTVLFALVLGWELLSHIVTAKGSYDEPLIPGWDYLIGNSLLRMSDYWGGGFGVLAPSEGGPPTYAAALLALGQASLVTFERVGLGTVFGVLGGIGLGLLVASSDAARRLIAPTVHIIRMTPFLAMIPLFNLWFGANTFGIILFVAYGIAVIMFTVRSTRFAMCRRCIWSARQPLGLTELPYSAMLYCPRSFQKSVPHFCSASVFPGAW